MDNWQLLQQALERSRADSAELHRERRDIGKLLDSIPPPSGVTCQSPAPCVATQAVTPENTGG
jgi:hypothetical protein